MELKIVDLVSADFLSADGSIPLWKRVLDAVVIVVGLPVIVPVMLAIALYIKVVSRGPVFFRQERIGYYGQPFTIYKFRTMHVNAPTNGHEKHLKELMTSAQPMTKLDAKGDARVIRGGGILRATGLDELPQLINVLRGDMSVVGPRPCMAYEYEQYSPWHSRRLEALPGLTGLWQVSGKNALSFERMIELDIHYAESCSIWLDLNIMLRTFPVLFGQVRQVLRRWMGILRKSRKAAVALEPAEAALVPSANADSFSRWSFRTLRTRRNKKCQTRLTLESSDVDTGVRT
ncbi:MAG TPA: sugar transferase [Candidatus Binatia bacterium]|nr:sugar transferase [Candidatus Binatia bacterium]